MDNIPPDGEEVDVRDITETQFLGGTFTSGFYGKFILSVKKTLVLFSYTSKIYKVYKLP